MARWRSNPTNANKWREASRAFREPRSAPHHCRGSMPPRSRDMSRAKHGSTAARQRAHPAFRATASVPSSSHRPAAPDERVYNGIVGLAGASASYRRGGREDRAARSAVNAAATSAERGAQAVHRDPGREAQGSLDQPNERTSALKRAPGRRGGYCRCSHFEARHGEQIVFVSTRV